MAGGRQSFVRAGWVARHRAKKVVSVTRAAKRIGDSFRRVRASLPEMPRLARPKAVPSLETVSGRFPRRDALRSLHLLVEVQGYFDSVSVVIDLILEPAVLQVIEHTFLFDPIQK